MKTKLISHLLLMIVGVNIIFAMNSFKLLPGQLLKNGMLLEYYSSDGSSPIYKVVSVTTPYTMANTDLCSKITMSYDGTTESTRIECIIDNFLYEAKEHDQPLIKSRPLAENLTFEKKDPNGIVKYKYVTRQFEIIKVENRQIKVLETVVDYYDKNGTIQSRLVEKYSSFYSTAISGKFQIPDDKLPGGWNTVTEFHLKKIIFQK